MIDEKKWYRKKIFMLLLTMQLALLLHRRLDRDRDRQHSCCSIKVVDGLAFENEKLEQLGLS